MNFPFFLSLWNRVQGQGTPDVHFKMAYWLERRWTGGDRRLLLMAFRSCGKSTIVGLFAAWLIYKNPDIRILVLAADMILARKMVRNVKRILERHPGTAGLRPERADQWGADRFTVKRAQELRDPTMIARGITSNITGSRADIIICDDVEVPRTCDSTEKRTDLRERLAESSFVLSPAGLQLYVGTPHSWYSLYAKEARSEIGEIEPFLQGYSRLEIPVLDSRGESAWPERFPMAEIESLKRRSGPNRFASQMMLQPVNIAEGRLNPAQLVRYDDELQMDAALKALHLGARRLISASAWWDPAFGGGDGSVLAVIFSDEGGARYLHRMLYLKPDAGGEDEATAQCRMVARAAKDYFLPFIALETNGIGKFLPAILRREIVKAGAVCAVREMHATRAKDERILEAFDVVMAAKLLHVHGDVYRGPFIREMQEWRPGRSHARDDGLDAAAGALSLEPVRLPRLYRAGGQGWMGAGAQHEAKQDFEV